LSHIFAHFRTFSHITQANLNPPQPPAPAPSRPVQQHVIQNPVHTTRISKLPFVCDSFSTDPLTRCYPEVTGQACHPCRWWVFGAGFLFFGFEVPVFDFCCFLQETCLPAAVPDPCVWHPNVRAQIVRPNWACVVHTKFEICASQLERTTAVCIKKAVCDTCHLCPQVPEDATACRKTGWKPFH